MGYWYPFGIPVVPILIVNMQVIMEKENICKNFGANYTGEYCPSCGQSSHTERLSVKEMWRVLLDTPWCGYGEDSHGQQPVAIPYTWIFRKYRITYKDGSEDSLNLAEHFNTLVYPACQGMVISLVYLPFKSIFHLDAGYVSNLALTIFLRTWCYRQLLGISWGNSLWRILVASILTFLVFIILLILMFGIFYGIDPNA